MHIHFNGKIIKMYVQLTLNIIFVQTITFYSHFVNTFTGNAISPFVPGYIVALVTLITKFAHRSKKYYYLSYNISILINTMQHMSSHLN